MMTRWSRTLMLVILLAVLAFGAVAAEASADGPPAGPRPTLFSFRGHRF